MTIPSACRIESSIVLSEVLVTSPMYPYLRRIGIEKPKKDLPSYETYIAILRSVYPPKGIYACSRKRYLGSQSTI